MKHVKNQKNAIHSQEAKKKSIETDPQRTQVLKLADKNF
jgi:hypothetical protein